MQPQPKARYPAGLVISEPLKRNDSETLMIINNTARTVETGNIATTQQFTIKASAKAFQILSAGLYSDRLVAILRELGCNAQDAHVAAGKPDVPFEVHLPGRFNPTLVIKDYGTGLPHDKMLNLYTTYFDSDKSETNDQIGGLGLGSKSPFSYVEAFTAVSRYNGKRRAYAAFLGSDGGPQITLLDTTDTDDPNGLEVHVPVKQEHMDDFRDRARKVYRYFNPLPVFPNDPEFEVDTVKYTTKGNGWGIRTGEYAGHKIYTTQQYESKTQAIMGAVAYPVDSHAVPSLSVAERAVLALPLDLHFGIGELDIAASREGLSYDQITQANIKARAQEVIAAFTTAMEAGIASCATAWQARIELQKRFENIGNAVTRFLDDTTIRYQGQPLRYIHRIQLHYDADLLPTVAVYTHDSWKRKQLKPIGHLGPAGWMAVKGGTTFIAKRHDTLTFNPILEYNFRGTHQNKVIVLIHVAEGGEAELQKLMDSLGNPDLTWLHDLPQPPRVAQSVRVTSDGTRVRSKTRRLLRWNIDIAGWTDTDRDETAGGLYIHTHNRNPVLAAPLPLEGFSYLMRAAKLLGYVDINTNVFGIQASFKRIPERNEGWIPVLDFLKEKLANDQTLPVKLQDIQNWHAWQEHTSPLKQAVGHLPKGESTAAMARYAAWSARYEVSPEYSRLEDHIKVAAQLLGVKLTWPQADLDLDDTIAQINREAPLLGLIANNTYRVGMKELVPAYLRSLNLKKGA